MTHANDHSGRVLVLGGGPDAERAVSLDSAREVAEALRPRFDVVEQTVDRPTLQELKTLITAVRPNVVFPVLHGTWGEGGPLQGLLEQLGVPFVGSDQASSALAMDKAASKTIAHAHNVPTPPWACVESGAACLVEPPLVLKPIDDGSSVDLRICRTAAEAEAAREHLHPRRGALLAERYIAGRELTVGLLGQRTLPLIEIRPAADFYDYAAKYERDDTQYVVEPPVSAALAARAAELALVMFERLGCRDLARVDFMLDDAGLWFLELNTMPGFTSHSLVPMAAAATGLPMPALTSALVEMAAIRGTSVVQK